MLIPKRAQQVVLQMPGPWTLLGIAIIIIGFFVIIFFTNNLSKPVFIAVFMTCWIPFWIGSYFDRKNRSRKIHGKLVEDGWDSVHSEKIDNDLLSSLQKMKPTSLNTVSIKSSITRLFNHHEVVVNEHIIGHGRYKQYLVSCAVWTPHEWPKTIIRKRVLIDRARKTQDLGVEAFDKEREIISDDLKQMAPSLSSMSEWFDVEKLKALTFRLMPPSGIREQWIFDGHWVIHADFGRLNPKTTTQMAEFLIAFVDQLETNTQE